jgi:hypothetical protein
LLKGKADGRRKKPLRFCCTATLGSIHKGIALMQFRETYLLRLIAVENDEDEKVTVIRLQSVRSGEEHQFADLKAMMTFLEKQNQWVTIHQPDA